MGVGVMMAESGKQLQDRWDPPTLGGIWAALAANEDLGALGVGRTPEGRWDLQGIAVPDLTVAAEESTTGLITEVFSRFVDFDGATFDRIDFSFASMAHTRFTDCSVADCVFDRADLSDLRCWRTSLRACSFIRTRLTGQMGAWSVEERAGNTVSSCLFDHVDLSDFGSSAGDFVGCHFLDVKMKDSQFLATIWERCVFTGTYVDVIFDGRDLWSGRYPGRRVVNTMAGCDFSGARLLGCAFPGIDTARLVLPVDDNLLVLDDARRGLNAAVDILARSTDGDPKIDRLARLALQRAVKRAPPTGQNIFDLSIYDDEDEVHRALAARLRAVLAQATRAV